MCPNLKLYKNKHGGISFIFNAFYFISIYPLTLKLYQNLSVVKKVNKTVAIVFNHVNR